MMRYWPIIVGTFLVAGCRHYQTQTASPEQTAAPWESRRLSRPGRRNFLDENAGHEIQNWPRKNWDLNSLTLAAFYFHPSLEVARAQWLVAVAGEKTAGCGPHPTRAVG